MVIYTQKVYISYVTSWYQEFRHTIICKYTFKVINFYYGLSWRSNTRIITPDNESTGRT